MSHCVALYFLRLCCMVHGSAPCDTAARALETGSGQHLGHTNLMFCFTGTATHYFAKMIYKRKLVSVAL